MKTAIKLFVVFAWVIGSSLAHAQSITGPSYFCVKPGENKTANIIFTTSDCILFWEEGDIVVQSGNQTFVVTKTYWPNGVSPSNPQCGGPAFSTLAYNATAPAPSTPTVEKSFRARYVVPGGTPVYSNIFTLIIRGEYKAGTISAATTTYLNSGSDTFQLTGNQGGVQWQYQLTTDPTWVTDGSANYSVTETKSFRAYKNNGVCLSDFSNSIQIEVFKTGPINGPTVVTEGERAPLSVVSGYKKVVQWEYSTDDGSTWTVVAIPSWAYRHQVQRTTKFRALIDLGPFGTAYTSLFEITTIPYKVVYANPTNGGNYMRQQQVTVTGITDASAVDALGVTQKHEVITYQDGVGRPVQQNVRKASPVLQKDIVTVSSYDGFGRNATQYLGYVSALNDGAYKANALTEQPAYYANGTSDKVTDSPNPYATTVFEKSPLARVMEQGGVGQQWQPGGGHSALVTYLGNAANEVWLFNSIGGSAAYYGVNELAKFETTNPDQKKTQKFVDKAGRTILTRTQLDEKVNGGSVATPWLETYFIYNELGGVKYILPPNGVEALRSASWVISQAILDQYAHRFVYDERGRLIEKKVPGQAWMYFCYDRLDRLVLMKDANTGTNKWVYIKYDRSGRPVMQGLYTNATYVTRAGLQQGIIDPLYSLDTDIYYEERGAAVQGYTNQAFPTSNTQVLAVNYYDNYDFDNNGTDDYAYASQALTNENTPITNVSGLPTGSKHLVLDGGAIWLFSYIFYDAYGHMIQERRNNHLNPAAIPADQDLVTAVYDFEGKVNITKKYHNAGSGRVTTVVNKFTYDQMGRLLKIHQNNNAAPTDQLVVQYAYNELGQLIDKKLHELTSGSSTFLQSVDMRYSIQGWLTSINNSTLTGDGVLNDETTDYFGMELLYEKAESGLTSSSDVLYSGNVSAIKWKGVGAASGVNDQRSYKFSYDKANRLRSATYQMSTGSVWTKEANALNENTGTVTGVSGYDFNGNIKGLRRNQRMHSLTVTGGVVTPTYGSELIDDLTYAYNSTQGDQLVKVTDAAARAEGFDNGTSSTNTDYTYDASGSGSLASDLNKGISAITYNHLGKPTLIIFTDTRKIEYTYDAAGTKLTMKTYKVGPVLQATIDYVDDFVYAGGTLSFFGSPEGRIVNNNNALEYQYSIADNQGNTRVVFTSATPPAKEYLATFEDPAADALAFQNIPNALPYWAPSGGGPVGTKAVQMNQNFKIGPAKSFKVYPGDEIDMEVWTYYTNNAGFGTSSPPLSNLITAIAASFGGVSGGIGESGSIFNGVSTALTSVGPGGNLGNTQPAAYLNYILFDKDYKLLDMGYTPATGYNVKQKISILDRVIKEAGYMFVYLSYENESNNFVQFDDLKIVHTQTNIVQYNEYYPYGLQAGTSWTRDQTTGNNYLFNEANELNPTTGWYETFFRNYDAALGRFTGIDPLATKFNSLNSYHFGFNNPVMFNDPMGAEGAASGQTLPNGWFDPPVVEYDNPTGAKFFGGDNRSGFEGVLEQMYNGTYQPGQAASGGHREVIPYGTYVAVGGKEVPGTRKIDGYRYIWIEGQTQENDPSESFWFIQNETEAYKFMLAIQNLPNGNGKEVVGVLSINKSSGKKGVLILPWADNQYDKSNFFKGYYGSYYEDFKGNRYSVQAMVHTHPENDIGPSTWGNARIGDLSAAPKFGGVPIYILGTLNYTQIYPSSSNPGSTFDLTRSNNPTSLFPK